MATTDLVPCFYTGQNFRWEQPAELRTRAELHRLKKLKLGRFDQNGKIFLFTKSIVNAAKNIWDGPLGRGNILPFAKAHNYGDKLHYEMPMAGDKTAFARSGMRRVEDGKKLMTRTKNVSSRVLFSQPGIQWMNYVRAAAPLSA